MNRQSHLLCLFCVVTTWLLLTESIAWGSSPALANLPRTQIIPDNAPGSRAQHDKLLNKWSIRGDSGYGFLDLEAVLDTSDQTLIYIGSIDQKHFTIETQYHPVDDKVSILGYCESVGHLYLEIVFINDLQIASMHGTIRGKAIAIEQENVNKELHWAYLTSSMLVAVLDIK
ncbi:MAG: hypothetical protein AAGC73_00980 [Verrucomicrobiota bacterium]